MNTFTMQAVLVVANNLLMSSGKIGSQCAHAALGLYKIIMANRVPWYPAFEVQQNGYPYMSWTLHEMEPLK